jgi:hypothetical protein
MLTDQDIRAIRDQRERIFRDGDRVELIHLAGPPEPHLPIGTEGSVYALAGRVCDDAGSLRVRWDNGSTLSVTAEDRVRRIRRADA